MNSSPAARIPQHLPALDGVRGLAIVLVLCHNFQVLEGPSDLVGRVFELAFDLGWIGVQMFFVLSGFLITRILLQTQDAPNYYSAFFGRRLLRIFPLYYATLAIAFIVLPALGAMPARWEVDRPQQAWLWLYLSNWSGPYGGATHAFPHFWSLAVEEQFYLLWPLLVHRRSAAQVLRWCGAIAVAILGVRIGMLAAGLGPDPVYSFTVTRLDALAIGGAAAAWLQLPGAPARAIALRQRLIVGALVLAAIGFVATRGYPRTSVLGQTLGYSVLAVVFALGVVAAAAGDAVAARGWVGWLRAAPLRMLGRYSYAMYIFHKPLHDLAGKPALQALGLYEHAGVAVAVGYIAAGTLVTLALAMASYHLFEKHFLGLKRWFVAEPPPITARSGTPAPLR
ncbi:acyltransferase family protein [Rhizobacter sp. P5_C2]